MKESNQASMANRASTGKWLFLSYPLSAETPAYGGGEGAVITQQKQIASGDSCNTCHWSFSNHLGTHLDFPRHFVRHGRTVDAFDAEFFVFEKIAVIDLGEVDPGEVISVKHLEGYEAPMDIEMLLIKTGFCMKRRSPVYWRKNPGFSPELADYLRNQFAGLRMIGFDSISLASYSNREMGRDAHRQFLKEPCPLLLLEDMDLARVSGGTRFTRLIVAPWMVSGADGVPCTVMANTNNRTTADET